MSKALLIVDVQNDFCPDGSYPIPNGDQVVTPLNQAINFARNHHWKIFASRDWHLPELFRDKPSSTHCLQNTKGAQFHPNLKLTPDITIISKGAKNISNQHYSAFSGDQLDLEKLLHQQGIKEIYIGGLALDYCVKNTALDSVNKGFSTHILLDACKPTNPKSGKNVIREMKQSGIHFLTTQEFLKSSK
jgi:nicotinamidase/pyrazinamidase